MILPVRSMTLFSYRREVTEMTATRSFRRSGDGKNIFYVLLNRGNILQGFLVILKLSLQNC